MRRNKRWQELPNYAKQNYMVSFKGLMGDIGKSPEKITPQFPKFKKPKKRNYEEYREQCIFVSYLEKQNILHYAVPNGGLKSMEEGSKLKRMGVKSGVPDICVPILRSTYGGLYIELKRKKGGVISDNQKKWLKLLQNSGQYVAICNGSDEAIKVVTDYLNGRFAA